MSFPQLIMMFKNCKIPKTFQLEVGLLGVARESRTTTTLGLGRNRTYHAKAAKQWQAHNRCNALGTSLGLLLE